jgi:glycosyltransferase involved in cell wall biosynthesis
MTPRVSLVIPAYNEAAYLPRLLDSVEAARAGYRHGSEAVEVVVADNGSTDATTELAVEWGCRVVHEKRRIIAAARNAGAREARGGILAFSDADARLHPETFNAIEDVLDTGRVVAGATGVKLERMSPGIAAAYAILVPMIWLTGMDTGVVFCRRHDFAAVGGYDEDRLFGEDVRFLLEMKRLGRGRGQRLARVRSVKAIASTRKFDQHGEWHYVAMLLRFAGWWLFAPQRMQEFARAYWYDGRRE